MENALRLQSSCERLCIPTIDPQTVVDAITQLVKVEADWVPSEPDTSLYIH